MSDPITGKKRKRRSMTWSRLKNFCKRFDFQFPTSLSSREKEHMCSCETCIDTWAMFCVDNLNSSMVENCEVWSIMTELDRLAKHKVLIQKQKEKLEKLTLTRTPNAYHIFRRKKKIEHKISFQEQNTFIANLWRALSPSEKGVYRTESSKLKSQRQQTIKNLSKYERIHYKLLLRRKAKKIGKNRPKKPKNSYMCYLAHLRATMKGKVKETNTDEVWTDADIVKLASQQWSNINEYEKSIYINQSQEEKKKYELLKARMQAAAKKTKSPEKTEDSSSLQLSDCEDE